jgi:alpha-mannosidase
MKNGLSLIILGTILFIFLNTNYILADNSPKIKIKTVSASSIQYSFPDSIRLIVQPFYRHRPDGKPGREITLHFNGPKFTGKGTIEVECSGKKEVIKLDANKGIDHFSVLLPSFAGVKSDCEAKIALQSDGNKLVSSVVVPAKRHWTVYIYPHSHVDIGYTNTHDNVEIIHKRNLINGIELAKKTASYPVDSRYLWNPEVLWPVERYLKTATPEERDNIIDAVRKGYLHLDAGYIHTNTSSSADEEFFEFFRHSKEMEKLTGKKIETLVQVDIPGMSWGVVPVASKLGIKYCFAMNNGSDRVGLSTELSFKPFWWLGPDGKSKMLFFQPGSYTPGAHAKGFAYWPLMAGQTDPSKLIQIVKTDNPRDNFVDKYLAEKLPELEKADYYPYDIFAMSWAMADNTPIDADLPDAVKSWNEDYAFPHLIIASATDIMQAFENKYGDQFPVLSGDFTEYWTDGLGTAAKQTAMNRSSKERLIQTETLWSMLHPNEPAPRQAFEEAWRNVIMGTEHTWCYMDPSKQPITNDILKVKFGFFQNAEDQSNSLLKSALSVVMDNSSSIVGVFNTLSWPRSGLVLVSPEQCKFFNNISDDKGNTILSQRLSTGELVFIAKDVPALGSKRYYLTKNKGNSVKNLAQGNTIDNGIVKVVIDPQTGDISSLTSGNYEFVNKEAKCALNSFRYLPGSSKPVSAAPQYATDSQTANNLIPDQSVKASGPSNIKIGITENGPLVASIVIESDAEGCKYLTREITLVAGQSHLEIKNVIDKKSILAKEGIHFGFGFNIPEPITRVDIPWGIMELEKDQLFAANRNWIAFQRWLDISNSDRGITFSSLDVPVFESGNMTANILGAATNSPEWIRKLQPSATIYSWALNNHWHTNFPLSQEGKIQFRYRILPHNVKYNALSASRFGLEQAQPLIVTSIKENFNQIPLVEIKGSQEVLISIIKPNIDGKEVQVRIRSVSSKDEKVKLVWLDRKPKSLHFIDSSRSSDKIEVDGEILVPAMGFLTINSVW